MIRGLEQRLRPPRLGSIGLGIKVKRGDKEVPQEVSYFVVDQEIAGVYKDKPTRLPIRFPWPEPEQVLHSMSYVLRKGRVVTRRCDGQTYVELKGGGQDVVGPCRLDAENPYAPCRDKCRVTARLSVVIPKTRLGIWEIRLGGLQRIADLLSSLRLYRTVAPLTQLPFEIERVETQEQYYKEDGEVSWRKGYPIHLRCPFTLEEVVAIQQARGLPMSLPPVPQEEDVVDAEEDDGKSPDVESEPPWTIERCFQVVTEQFGLTAKAYGLYLQATYKKEPSDLAPAELSEQRELLLEGLKAPGKREGIIAGANEASKQKNAQGRLI